MTDEMKENDATRFLVVAMDHDGFKVLEPCDSEARAKQRAISEAEQQDGRIIGVFQKIGTARAKREVEWRGMR